jgi:hypothetical protein
MMEELRFRLRSGHTVSRTFGPGRTARQDAASRPARRRAGAGRRPPLVRTGLAGRADPTVLVPPDPARRTRSHDRERRSAIVSCSASSSGVGLIPNPRIRRPLRRRARCEQRRRCRSSCAARPGPPGPRPVCLRAPWAARAASAASPHRRRGSPSCAPRPCGSGRPGALRAPRSRSRPAPGPSRCSVAAAAPRSSGRRRGSSRRLTSQVHNDVS